MTLETARVSGPVLDEYAAISIAFEVTSVLSVATGAANAIVLTEHRIDRPYIKDYDAISERPGDWPPRFDTSQWALVLARVGGRAIGGAAVAVRTPALEMFEGRDDLAVLWDIRVTPAFRGRGVGRALYEAAEAWALAQGCRELKVETQNVNVAACRFYAAAGCELRVVREDAYAQCPGEAQLLWYKALGGRVIPSRPRARR